MPIRPENKDRYPPDWPQIRQRILERAGNRCEGSPKYPDCRIPNGHYRATSGEQSHDPWELMCRAKDPTQITRIVLTIGHLDHTPENCDPENLRAWCQRCHLTYDAKIHAAHAYGTRRKPNAIGDLPGIT